MSASASTRAEARAKLESASLAIGLAASALGLHRGTMEAFLKEARDMENFGHILDPTLFRDPERRAVNAVIEPLFRAGLEFLDTHEAHLIRARAALAKVSA